jgi:hypothetical protein
MLLEVLLMVVAATPGPGTEPRGRVSVNEEAADVMRSPYRRVRSTDPVLARLIDSGVRRSHSFAALVLALHETDVIVYVEHVQALPRAVDGLTFLIPSRDHQRYVRVQVRQALHPDETIALLAHELRHALEVASDPSVTTRAAFVALYERIGQAVHGSQNRFDTPAAQEMGRMVRRELGG